LRVPSFQHVFEDLRRYIAPYGVCIDLKPMSPDQPGVFDGPRIDINQAQPLEARCHYLAHSFGSIAQWSTHFEEARKTFDELHKAKNAGPGRLEEALRGYRLFEQTSSEHAVWMLNDMGRRSVIPSYTVFFRADIEAMTIFHRTGHAPRWPDYFSQWRKRAAAGGIWIEPFTPKPFPWFRPVQIPTQGVLQER
jgi:hypothetical protein